MWKITLNLYYLTFENFLFWPPPPKMLPMGAHDKGLFSPIAGAVFTIFLFRSFFFLFWNVNRHVISDDVIKL